MRRNVNTFKRWRYSVSDFYYQASQFGVSRTLTTRSWFGSIILGHSNLQSRIFWWNSFLLLDLFYLAVQVPILDKLFDLLAAFRLSCLVRSVIKYPCCCASIAVSRCRILNLNLSFLSVDVAIPIILLPLSRKSSLYEASHSWRMLILSPNWGICNKVRWSSASHHHIPPLPTSHSLQAQIVRGCTRAPTFWQCPRRVSIRRGLRGLHVQVWFDARTSRSKSVSRTYLPGFLEYST